MKIPGSAETSLKAKFMIGTTIIVFTIALLAGSMFFSLQRLSRAFEETINESNNELYQNLRLEVIVQQSPEYLHDYIFHGDLGARKRVLTLNNVINKQFKDILSIQNTAKERRLIRSASEHWREAQAIDLSILAAPDRQSPEIAHSEQLFEEHSDPLNRIS